MSRTLPTFALTLSLLPAAALAQPIETSGTIEAVTVYRGQALVTRLVEVPPAKALAEAAGTVRELVVTDLPSKIRPESIHAEASGALTVRSVRFRQRPVVQDTREEVRKIDARIEGISDKQAADHKKADLIAEHRALLASLQQFVAPTATVELTRGVLNAETLEKLATFIKDQRAKLADDELALGTDARKLQADLEQAQRERQLLTAASSRTAYEAVVLLGADAPAGAPGSVRLRYLVDDATWSPSYNVRADSHAQLRATPPAPAPGAKSQVALEYYASIQQMSGEDWGNIAMTLSTATPSLIARPPTLSPISISLTGAIAAGKPAQIAYADARKDLVQKQKAAENFRAQNSPRGQSAPRGGAGGAEPEQPTDIEADRSLNSVAGSIQVLDLVAGEKVARDEAKLREHATEEGLSVTYTLSAKTTLPSRADRQLIQIASIPLKADFAKIATPVLTGYVYDEATAVNTSSMVLLAGPVTAYADGAFVGSGELPTVAIGQSFTTGFGIDSSLHAARELVERTESIQGGNRVVDLTYRLTVENFSSAAAPLRLLERLPKVCAGTGASDIRVTLVSPGADLSTDDDYVKTLKKEGILRWDLTVPPQSIGPTAAATIEYKFRLEYDKQMTLAGMGG
jgi:Domain of unknown function (DUF4139)/N-terminal domain of unknown function (DUF4140)